MSDPSEVLRLKAEIANLQRQNQGLSATIKKLKTREQAAFSNVNDIKKASTVALRSVNDLRNKIFAIEHTGSNETDYANDGR